MDRSGLYGGYIAANCLKWYWWRFNANGFFWGMASGYCRRIGMSSRLWGITWMYEFLILVARYYLYCQLAGCLDRNLYCAANRYGNIEEIL